MRLILTAILVVTPLCGLGYGVDFDITVLNSFTCPYAQEIKGLDYIGGETAITFASNLDDLLYTCDAEDGTYIDDLELSYTGNPHPFGVCYDDNDYVHVNDYSQNDIHWNNYSSWDDYSNPSDNKGSGMDFDGTYIWETYWTDGVYRFFPDGSGAEFFYTDEVTTQMSGLAVFPYNSNLGIIVATHGNLIFYFYEFDGSSTTYLGNADCPLIASQSRGLTYSQERGTFFWSYGDGGVDWISELGIDFYYTAVQPASVGNIKAIFH